MRHTEIAIVGGGLAGATAAAMLGRAGVPALLIDPNPVYPPEFRCEKLDATQLRVLERTGLTDAVLPSGTSFAEVWIARFGRLIYRRANDQYVIAYGTLVNAMRAAIGGSSQCVAGKVTAIAAGDERQIVTLSSGEEISARLVVLATGLNNGLRHSLGIIRQDISRQHSISIGFDMTSTARGGFAFSALTYFGERARDGIAYLALFPLDGFMRANLFVYREITDPWLKAMRESPCAALLAEQPRLKRLLGEFETGPVHIRPVDLYRTQGYRRSGVVLVGDAFATSCPAAGTGVTKVFTDVLQLCAVHIPQWLKTPGMGADKIAGFYDDPKKTKADAYSERRAYYIRAVSTDPRLQWRLRRAAKFVGQWGLGLALQTHARLPVNAALDTAPAGSRTTTARTPLSS